MDSTDLWSKYLFLNSRSETESSRLDDDENVDLEKSNVLLMGPTGSGIIYMFQILYFMCSSLQTVLGSVSSLDEFHHAHRVFLKKLLNYLLLGNQGKHYLQKLSLVLSMYLLSLLMQPL